MLADYSVAMCTFNGAYFVLEQLDSIASQTHPPKEILVCDDGSADNTVELIRKFSELHPLINVRIHINKRNLGFIKNFEQAISLCTYEYILLSDQDDYWVNNKAELQVGFLSSNPSKKMVFSDAYRTDSKLMPIQPDLWQCVHFSALNQQRFMAGQALSVLLRHNIVTGATVALTKEFVHQQFPFNDEYPHDAWLALKAAQVDAIGFIPQKLIKYRQHETNALGAVYDSKLTKARKALTGYWRSQFPPEFFMRLKAYQALIDSEHCLSEQGKLVSQVKAFQEFRLSIMEGKQERLNGFRYLVRYWRNNYYNNYAAAKGSLVKDMLRLIVKSPNYTESTKQ
ncbi:glycosyltransferase family 2 protein [Agarivorans aestuarii]|uniref:Glycosyltransferase family 2 protein n=1 Tax=Agarivorans aestuarii TaxID=1563703 RepID=A0ABU7G1G6_9ALTE|nr:glycosyltransferase family 2 protein [Agarivorans aestuarii]MEE1672799.1 glycosyltransferase family 2 protein [Agarivorans aestuarii]